MKKETLLNMIDTDTVKEIAESKYTEKRYYLVEKLVLTILREPLFCNEKLTIDQLPTKR